MKKCFLFFLLISSLASVVQAQQTTDLVPETQGAKALLEDLIAKRYRQELATLVDSSMFHLSARLELIKNPDTQTKPQIKDASTKEIPVITDLMLGSLDPEEILKNYSPPEQAEITKQFFENYRIKTVAIAIGLKEGLPGETKPAVEKWLKERLTKEFGKNTTGTVSIQQRQVEQKTIEKKELIDWLNQFQGLAGQLALALALLLGVILWRLLGGSSQSNSESNSTSQGGAAAVSTGGGGSAGGGKGGGGGADGDGGADGSDTENDLLAQERREREKQLAVEGLGQTSKKVIELLPHLSQNFEALVRSWCQMGESGRYRLAVFAEAVGKEIGRLPIPIDALNEVGKVFTKMLELPPQEKLATLQKAYWDILSVINLGPDILNQPFGYIGGLDAKAVNQILVDQNPKLKTLVSLYMPSEMRSKYFKGLDVQAKLDLLQQACDMDSIPTKELNSLDQGFRAKIQPKGNNDVVVLDRALQKVVEALRPQEEISLLASIQGPAIEAYKRSVPSLAFLDQWADDKLKVFLAKVRADELLPYLRLKPANKNRFMGLLPQLTADMLAEEIDSPDKSSADEKDQWLVALKNRLIQMFELKELQLDDIFSQEDTHDLKKAS